MIWLNEHTQLSETGCQLWYSIIRMCELSALKPGFSLHTKGVQKHTTDHKNSNEFIFTSFLLLLIVDCSPHMLRVGKHDLVPRN